MLFTKYLAVVVVVALVAAALYHLKKYLANKELQKFYAEPLEQAMLNNLKKHVPLSNKVPAELLQQYHGHINYFLHDKEFVGRGGMVIDDKVKIVIAGNACLMTLKREGQIYPGFKTIIVYPETYHAPGHSGDALTVNHKLERRAGESWYRGPVVLAWNNTLHGSHNPNDGHNVVIHEFAHKLDEENRLMDGLPILRAKEDYESWAEVLSAEYDSFLKRVDARSNKVIDSYGAVSPVEFFSVVTESFFEKPAHMKRKLPALYAELSRYYGIDIAEWS